MSVDKKHSMFFKDDPCSNYKILDSSSRNYASRSVASNSEKTCDQLGFTGGVGASPDWKGPNIYRFVGAAGSRMATRAEVRSFNKCGVFRSGYLDVQKHPEVAPGERKVVKACFWGMNYDRCENSNNVRIIGCQGFYVYELPKVPNCTSRYCGGGSRCE